MNIRIYLVLTVNNKNMGIIHLIHMSIINTSLPVSHRKQARDNL